MRTAAAFVLLAVAAICGEAAPVLAQPEPRPPIAIVQKIPLPGVYGRMDHMSLLRGAGIAVAALGNNSVEMVDGSARVIASIPGQDRPQGVRYVAEIDKLFVANGGASKHKPDVRVYTGDTYQLVKNFDIDFEGADNIRYDPAATLLYVSYEQGLATINTTTLERLQSYKFPEHPESFQLEAKGSRIFVNLPLAGAVAVLDRKNGQVTSTWKVTDARTNFAMALDEDNHRLFSVFRNPSSVKVFDTDSGRVVATLACVVDVDDIWFEPTRKRIYVTGGEGFVDVFQQLDPDHYTRIGHVPTAIGARTSIIWATRTRQGMTIAAPAYYPDGSAALLGAQFVDY
jgi:DNA-binding beta-propeller fold protein YncE